MIGIPIAHAVSDAFEWVVHKHVLHGAGRKKGSFWSFHWHEHHRNARRHDHRDPSYERSVFGWHGQGKEALGLAGVALAHAPLLPLAPFYTATVWYRTLKYYRVHKRAHQDPAWARRHLPWHYDHHMGPNQDANWGVTSARFDRLMGTREPYVGTEREARDRERSEARRARVEARRRAATRGEDQSRKKSGASGELGSTAY